METGEEKVSYDLKLRKRVKLEWLVMTEVSSGVTGMVDVLTKKMDGFIRMVYCPALCIVAMYYMI